MADFLVTTNADIVDIGDGVMSLREALIFANAGANADTISFDASLSGSVINLTQGAIEITEAVTIDGDISGDGVAEITISGDALGNDVTDAAGITDVDASLLSGAAMDDGLDNDGDGFVDHVDIDGETPLDDNIRPIEITAVADVTLKGLNISGGRVTTDNEWGGGIHSVGVLTIQDSTVAGNMTTGYGGFGGGVFGNFLTIVDSEISGNRTFGDAGHGGGVLSNGPLEMVGSEISGNATLGYAGFGGGLVTLYDATITDSVISGNTTAGRIGIGGGMYAIGAATITGSEISNNATSGEAAHGGGLIASGRLDIVNSEISGNATSGYGAQGGGILGIDPSETTTITGSVISGNSTAGDVGRGGGMNMLGVTTIIDSEISGNATTGPRSPGGGVYAHAPLTLIRSAIADNSTSGYVGAGGGIFAKDTLTVLDSTISGNSTAGYGANGGGVSAIGAVRMTNTTLAGNSTAGDLSVGGAMMAFDGATFINATVTGNSTAGATSYGGGLSVAGDFVVENSIVTGNVSAQTNYDDTQSDPTYIGDAIIGHAFYQNGFVEAAGFSADDIFADVTEILTDSDGDGTPDAASGVFGGVLGDHGGPVQTIALLANGINPALDAGDDSALNEVAAGLDANGDGDTKDLIYLDANGAPRFFDQAAAGDGINLVDLGAAELQTPVALVVTTLDDETNRGGDIQDDANDGTGLSLREAIELAGAGDSIIFDPSLAGGTLALTQGSLSIFGEIDINGDVDGDGKADITISGNGISQAFDIFGPGTAVELRSLELTDGLGPSGGAIYVGVGATLDLVNSSLHGNTSIGDGGAIFNGGYLTAVNSTISDNSAATVGGGINNAGGAMSLVNVTIDGNYAGAGGSGIETSGATLIMNSTITDNTGAAGISGSFNPTIFNSVVALNTDGAGVNDDLDLPDAVAVNSFFGSDESAIVGTANVGNFHGGGDPLLGALQDNGGPVETRAPSALSPLINGGDANLLPFDELDLDGDGDAGEDLPLAANGAERDQRGAPDIGAHETGSARLISDAARDGDGTVIGTDGDDYLFGFGGDDTLSGQSGDDNLAGGAGADALDGGAGTDAAVYSLSNAGVVVNLNNAATESGGDAEGDRLVNIENLAGSEHDDELTGDAGANWLYGLAGDDILNGFNGEDTLSGGEGNDTLDGGALSDTLFGDTGDDTLLGGTADDTLFGDFGDDWLVGGEGADAIDGGDGVDTASYASSAAAVRVNLNDTAPEALGEAAGDTLVDVENLLGSGHGDTLVGDASDNRLAGMDGDDVLTGNNGADTLLGGDGADTLNGGALTDLLFGGLGNDILTGGAGVGDLLAGEAGHDVFVLALGDGEDVITDFGLGADRIDLAAFAAKSDISDLDIIDTAAGNAVIRLGADKFTLLGVNSATLDNADFIFA